MSQKGPKNDVLNLSAKKIGVRKAYFSSFSRVFDQCTKNGKNHRFGQKVPEEGKK